MGVIAIWYSKTKIAKVTHEMGFFTKLPVVSLHQSAVYEYPVHKKPKKRLIRMQN